MKCCLLIHKKTIENTAAGDNYDSLQFKYLMEETGWDGLVVSSGVDIPSGYDVLLGVGIRFWTGSEDQKIKNYPLLRRALTVEFQDGYGYKKPILADLCLYHVTRPGEVVGASGKFRYVGVGVYDQHLYSEQDDHSPVAFLDHYHKRRHHMERSFALAKALRKMGWKIYHLNQHGLVVNPDEISYLPYRLVPHIDICSTLRKTHLFINTHAETQGMTQIEASLCGAVVVGDPGDLSPHVLQSLPFLTFDQFDPTSKINFVNNSIEAKKKYSFGSFARNMIDQIGQHLQQRKV